VGDGGIDYIGGMQTGEYIKAKDREDISVAVNAALLGGAQKLWFEGFPLDIQQMIDPKNYQGKTPVTIVNVKHLGFADQAYVVGYIAYQIWFWMRRLEGVEEPRLIFYVDEIGGGGGKQAFFPSVAASPSKPALSQLLRQGRAFGVCCMFATQSPGDIDYRGLGQCGTWAVGQLRRQRERKKIEEGAGVAEVDFDLASKHIASFATGQFFITAPSLGQTFLEERWLMHLHRVVSATDLERVKEDYEKGARDLFEEAGKCRAGRDLRKAKQILESIIRVYRFSAICAGASVQLGEVLYEMSDYENAIRHLQEMTKYRLEAEEVGQAYFLIGKCMEEQGRFEEATREFGKVRDSAASEDIKRHAVTHEGYCKNRSEWPKLTNIQKFCWWIVGRKPDPAGLIRLQAEDRELVEKEFKGVLEKQDFAIPDPIDYQALLDARQRAAEGEEEKVGERIQAERWARDQVPKIEALLSQGALKDAAGQCRKIVQRLKDAKGNAGESVISAIKRCNKQRDDKEQALSNKLRLLDARQFEFEIARLFRLKGYRSFATQLTGDDGVDVYACRDDERIVIQCKRWKHPVGRNIVDELAGVRSRHDAARAIVATTSTFSEGAIEAGHKHQIELWDFERIRREWEEALGKGT
jgi:HJR/Mrr/RecB family endonuclease